MIVTRSPHGGATVSSRPVSYASACSALPASRDTTTHPTPVPAVAGADGCGGATAAVQGILTPAGSAAAVVVAEVACVKDTVLEDVVHCGAKRGNQAGLM